MKIEQPAGLINVLMDSKVEFGDRDDAAMDLSAYDSPEAYEALLNVGTNPNEDPDLQDSCGQSLAEICSRKPTLDLIRLTKLAAPARGIFLATLLHFRPEWKDLVEGLRNEN